MDGSKEGIPRRLELDDEIIQYLQTLDGQISKNGIEESDKESVEILVNNVLSEIKNRCGSLASDRKTSLIIEKLVLLSYVPQLIEFCRKLSPYVLFLAKNRYSSHVLQVNDRMLATIDHFYRYSYYLPIVASHCFQGCVI